MTVQSVLFSSDLRALEAHHRDLPLMQRAGEAAAATALRLLAGSTGPVLVFAGPGNNGGDAFVAARLLRETGCAVQAVFFGSEQKLPTDASAAYAQWRAAGGQTLADWPQDAATAPPALALDGLFGIGLTRPLEGRYAALIERINRLTCPILALDLPSGLDANSGRILGAAVVATHTASFIAAKPGLYTLDGPDHCGEVSHHNLGITDIPDVGEILTIEHFAAWLRPRKRNTHKGDYGDAVVIGGAPGMVGAALLAGRAALRLGAGRVFLGLLTTGLPVDARQPELMLRTAEEALALAATNHAACAIGPGLGQSAAALALLRRALTLESPLLIDADGLNLIAAHPVLAKLCARRAAATLITPHPAEGARLLATTTATVQMERIGAARRLAQRLNAQVALKGCGSVLATPQDAWRISSGGNAGLATAGSGDVLSGIALALLAQGWSGEAALAAAVYVHAAAADLLVRQGIGMAGLTAGELIPAARALFNRLLLSGQ